MNPCLCTFKQGRGRRGRLLSYGDLRLPLQGRAAQKRLMTSTSSLTTQCRRSDFCIIADFT